MEIGAFGATLLAAAITWMSTAAITQTPMRIRGTITSLEGNVLNVKARDGKDLKIGLPENLVLVAAKAMTFADIKPGDRSLLVPGAYIVTGARVGTDGVIFTQRITVSKDGVKPAN